MNDETSDIIIVGGGLAGSLCALALARRRPAIDILLVERDDRLGGNHIWSYFSSDVDEEMRWLTDAVTVQRWDCNAVRFPHLRRLLDTRYNSITSERLDQVVTTQLGDRRVHGEVVEIGPAHVALEDGRRLEARAVLDARGLDHAPGDLECGWQKFVGQMLEVAGGHRLTHPVIMDATMDQSDGYRFVYLLPFDEERIFIEDTYYQRHADLDRDRSVRRIAEYARDKGWNDTRVIHEEQGVLPVVISGRFSRFWPADDPVARAGVAGGFFHPLTSYSLPDAVRFAGWLMDVLPMDGEDLARAARQRASRHWRQSGFYRLLGRMLFRAADPPRRVAVFERFYRLPDRLIERFYAGRSSFIDKLRILTGRPPVPLHKALLALLGIAK